MRKCINKVIVQGYLYQHSLAVKTVQDKTSENFGKEFINGTIDIVVDETGLNVVPVHYTYVTPTTKAGAVNRTYTILKSIIDNDQSWIKVGKDAAMKLKCEPSFALNDFYANDGTLVSQTMQEGGFISVVNGEFEGERNKFELDCLITNVSHIDADEEKNIAEDYCTVRGAGFNFRNAILPMNFVIKNPKGMEYFEDLDASAKNPVFIKVWGKVNNISTKVEKREESAFGEDSVTTYERKVKEWVITGAAPAPYDFGDENVLTVAEVQTALQDREVLLAETKRRSDEYRANKTAISSVTPAPAKANTPAFNF